MLILRSRTLIPRSREIKGQSLPLLHNDASETSCVRLAVIPVKQFSLACARRIQRARLVRELPLLAV